MSREEERLARAALCRLSEPGDPRMATLVADLGAVTVHQGLLGQRELGGVLSDVAERLAGIDPSRDLELADRQGIRFVIPGDAEWPGQLGALAHAGELQQRGGVPLGLWVRGPVRLDALAGSVAVVGSRSASSYGGDVAREMARVLAESGLPVISGAAFGIDQAAHRGALSGGGPTVAVMACGVDRAYPTAHRDLLDHLAAHGAVVSEAAPGCAPMRIRFLSRNRLIAALTAATVVVEASIRSGALNTANWAARLNRHLLAVPGPVTSAQSQGVHQLIRTGGAMLATSGDDVLEVVGRPGEHLIAEPRAETRARDRLSQRDQMVLDAVPVVRSAKPDSIARTAGVGLKEVAGALLRLQKRGMVERQNDGWVLAEAAKP